MWADRHAAICEVPLSKKPSAQTPMLMCLCLCATNPIALAISRRPWNGWLETLVGYLSSPTRVLRRVFSDADHPKLSLPRWHHNTSANNQKGQIGWRVFMSTVSTNKNAFHSFLALSLGCCVQMQGCGSNIPLSLSKMSTQTATAPRSLTVLPIVWDGGEI